MPSIPFLGIQTIGSTAQPVFGTTTTAAASPTYDQFAGNVTGANPSMTTISVSSTAGFRTNQYIVVTLGANYGNTTPNEAQIKQIISSTSMKVEGLNQDVPNGAYVLLSEVAESISIIQQSTNTGTIYVGTAPTVSATDTSVIDTLIPSGNYFHAETTAQGHAYNTSQYWVSGTAGDKFVANFTQG